MLWQWLMRLLRMYCCLWPASLGGLRILKVIYLKIWVFFCFVVFLFVFNYMHMCMCIYVYEAGMCGWVRMFLGSSGVGVTNGCELSKVSAGDLNWSSVRSAKAFNCWVLSPALPERSLSFNDFSKGALRTLTAFILVSNVLGCLYNIKLVFETWLLFYYEGHSLKTAR